MSDPESRPESDTKSGPWPTELRLSRDKRTLTISFDDGELFELSAELLRVSSPSAELQGHSEAERQTVGGKRTVAIRSIMPVGNYAVRLAFDDGHQTGIYSWILLHDLGKRQDWHQAEYERALRAKGLDRDRPGQR